MAGGAPHDTGQLTVPEVYAIAEKAGFDKGQAVIMTAIAMAESGLHYKEIYQSDKTKDNSYGLWQINMYGDLGPERQQKFGLTSYNDLLDPLTNAKVAYAISSKGNDFTPWSTYTSGKYWDNVNTVITDVSSVPGSAPGLSDYVNGILKGLGNPVGTIVGGLTGAKVPQDTKGFGSLMDVWNSATFLFNPANWMRIQAGIAGAVLALIGIIFIAKGAAQNG